MRWFDDFHTVKIKIKRLCLLRDRFLVAEKNRLRNLLVQNDLRGTKDLLFVAFGKDYPLGVLSALCG